jgi:hypothetical protein
MHGETKGARTESKIASPVFIASAGGNDYRIGIRDAEAAEHHINGLGTYNADSLTEGGTCRNLGKSRYDTLKRLGNFIASSEFIEGPCLLLEKGGN